MRDTDLHRHPRKNETMNTKAESEKAAVLAKSQGDLRAANKIAASLGELFRLSSLSIDAS
jgi:hypothetical protein